MNETKLNSSNDVYAENGRIARLQIYSEMALQKIRTVAQTFHGECFTNREIGVPYFEKILGSEIQSADVSAAYIRDAILEIPEVESVEITKIDISIRGVSLTYSAVLANGETVNGEV